MCRNLAGTILPDVTTGTREVQPRLIVLPAQQLGLHEWRIGRQLKRGEQEFCERLSQRKVRKEGFCCHRDDLRYVRIKRSRITPRNASMMIPKLIFDRPRFLS